MEQGSLLMNAIGGESEARNVFSVPELNPKLFRTITTCYLIKQGKIYLSSAPEYSYQVDSDEKKRKRERSRSRSRTPPPSRSSSISNRLKRTQFKRNVSNSAVSRARLEAINRREREQDAIEAERARSSYRQPNNSPKRRRIQFGGASSSNRSPQAHGGSPVSSPTKFKTLNIRDESSDDDL